ncbi:hydroxylamine reductase [Parabacteroides sp. FAFU027]|uniref:hydroxylamine reductase n=1 Tax=Parabacteroides sp. FAFU027 TaxID=2922715 RepID=UPI001FAF6808|nr:hydroxylamine reductase [Parabacteroides sp. FAFU027]
MENMFCFQCQEAAKGTGCTIKGVCGKDDKTANIMDLLIYVSKGISVVNEQLRTQGANKPEVDHFILDALFCTITNANFDVESISARVTKAVALKAELLKIAEAAGIAVPQIDEVKWAGTPENYETVAKLVGVLKEKNEDVRSLKELVIYGLKGMAAYAEHAYNLGFVKDEISTFIQHALAQTTRTDISADELVALTLETGKYGVDTMGLLDTANTTRYGNPEITSVNIGVSNKPGILISGHDLKDIEELLAQTEGTGVDVYTHSEMLPAHYYPAFKKYSHFVGNYGNAWWKQREEFESFNGPVLFTTNCIVPPLDKAGYKDRIYTTGSTGFPGWKVIPAREDGKTKDFSEIIEHAKRCASPTEIESGTIVGGFAHEQVFALADKVVDAVKTGAIRKFVVMAGCDGRMNSRDYYSEFAQGLPQDSVILTAGCAKYRYNKLPLGDIGGIPRVLDAGQCNDSYSLALIALKLKEVFELEDINELPIVYNIAWYEQKAVIVLLALLYLGVKNINLGPTLPAFLSPNVAKVLVENFGIGTISTPEADLAAWVG